jgi:hypothetical protein
MLLDFCGMINISPGKWAAICLREDEIAISMILKV